MITERYWGILLLNIILICLISKSTNAQVNNGFSESGLSETEINSRFLFHRRLMHQCMKDYMEYSSFQNENKRVSSETIERFKDLFLDNARVWNDYLWEPKMEYARVYADIVYFYHRIHGLKVQYDSEELERMLSTTFEAFNPRLDNTDLSNHTFRYEYKIKKGIYYILNKKDQVLYYDEPIEYDLQFVFYVSSKEKWAKIMDILPVK